MSAPMSESAFKLFKEGKTLITDRSPVVKDGFIILGNDGDNASVSQHSVQEIMPVTNVGFGNAPLQFDITQGLLTDADSIFLHFQITNGSTGSTTPACPCYFVDHYEVRVNSNQIMQNVPNDIAFFQLGFFTWSQLQRALYGNAMNLSVSDYLSPTAVSAGATVDYYIPLNFLAATLINYQTTSNTVSLMVYLQPSSSACVVSGAGPLTIGAGTSLLVLNHTDMAADKIITRMYKELKGAKLTFPDFFYSSYGGITLTPSQKISISITNINRSVTMAIVSIRTSKSANGWITFQDLTGGKWFSGSNSSLDLQNQSGVSILSSRPLSPGEYNLLFNTNIQNDFVLKVPNLYFLRLTEKPVEAFFNGDQTGGSRLINENVSLLLTPGSNFNSGSALTGCIVDVMWVSHHMWVEGPNGYFTPDH